MKTYLIANINIHDGDHFADYAAQVPGIIAKHNGRYLVRGGESEVVEGSWQPQRVVVLEFPSRHDADNFINDPEYAPIAAIRHEAAHTDLVIVDGVPTQ